jgi:hypothetical protein
VKPVNANPRIKRARGFEGLSESYCMNAKENKYRIVKNKRCIEKRVLAAFQFHVSMHALAINAS